LVLIMRIDQTKERVALGGFSCAAGQNIVVATFSTPELDRL
jgi:hypothetical protein